MSSRTSLPLVCLVVAGLSGPATSGELRCDPAAESLTLPEGLCAVVVAEELGRARHITVRDRQDLYVVLGRPQGGGAVVALRDVDFDGRADRVERFGERGGTGIGLHDGYLYVGTDTEILRYRLEKDRLLPVGEAESVVAGFPEQDGHRAKSLAFDGEGHLYVNVGAPSNTCQEEARTPGSPGLEPCPQLEEHAGIWRFDADATGQRFADGDRFAMGIRNAVALAWRPSGEQLYVVQHGRDQLHGLWPQRYSVEDNAELPAEEMLAVDEGDDFGWPYCYYDGRRHRKVLAPEYGGNGEKVGSCAEAEDPVASFPAHWAPNDLVFTGGGGPAERYASGAFIAFHGSWNRAPLPQAGYNVVFVPFDDSGPAGDWEVFAEGFAGKEELRTPGNARHRPTGLALGPDGSLFVADSVKGRIWRIIPRPEGEADEG